MPVMRPNVRPTDQQLRWFGCLWTPLALFGLAVLTSVPPAAHAGALVLAMGAVTSVTAGLIRPSLLRPLFVGLVLVSFPLAWIVSHLALATFYFGVITPVAIASRALGRDPLRRARGGSGWVARPGRRPASHHLRQF